MIYGDTLNPQPGDIFVTWNRISTGERVARLFESRGLPVLVTENAAWGNGFAGDRWYSLAKTYHNTAGCFPVGGHDRWDALGVELAPFREFGETVLLPQRGIGSKPTVMARSWPGDALKRYGGRVRAHPGQRPAKPLEDDLAHCGRVITWGSGAAIKALMMGIPVISEMPRWIGEQDNTDIGRLAMFRRLAWAQWRLSEFESGEAFAWLLE
ncbi:MAG: hypothetical protein KDH99_01525 [Alcanivoracaceae bacterium]|nr:hypothetical protein [Alcanivoracaceae bacterium]